MNKTTHGAPTTEILRAKQFEKTKPCRFFKLGNCVKNDACPFAHETEEQRPLPDLGRTKMCPNKIATGVCNNSNCKFAHGKNELRATDEFVKTKMCKHFIPNSASASRKCSMGDSCRYAHSQEDLHLHLSQRRNSGKTAAKAKKPQQKKVPTPMDPTSFGKVEYYATFAQQDPWHAQQNPMIALSNALDLDKAKQDLKSSKPWPSPRDDSPEPFPQWRNRHDFDNWSRCDYASFGIIPADQNNEVQSLSSLSVSEKAPMMFGNSPGVTPVCRNISRMSPNSADSAMSTRVKPESRFGHIDRILGPSSEMRFLNSSFAASKQANWADATSSCSPSPRDGFSSPYSQLTTHSNNKSHSTAEEDPVLVMLTDYVNESGKMMQKAKLEYVSESPSCTMGVLHTRRRSPVETNHKCDVDAYYASEKRRYNFNLGQGKNNAEVMNTFVHIDQNKADEFANVRRTRSKSLIL